MGVVVPELVLRLHQGPFLLQQRFNLHASGINNLLTAFHELRVLGHGVARGPHVLDLRGNDGVETTRLHQRRRFESSRDAASRTMSSKDGSLAANSSFVSS